MSLLTPVKIPVKVYRSTDVNAPLFDKKANCVATILKACLVTGYGAKEGAGWTLAFEDLVTKAKVFGFNSQTADPLYLRVYNDTGQSMGVQLAKSAINANTVTVLTECDTVFKYLGGIATGEWMVIASDKGFWFFAPVNANAKPSNRSGAFLFSGIVPGTQSDGFVIKHTGGSWSDTDDDRHGISITETAAVNANSGAATAAAYNIESELKAKNWLTTISLGTSNESPVAIAAPLYFKGAGDVYQLPIYSPSRNDLNNFDVVNGVTGANVLNFCTSMQSYDTGNNAYVPIDFWGY